MSKKLQITAGTSYDSDFQTVPVNSGHALTLESNLGLVLIQLSIKDFEGSASHHAPKNEKARGDDSIIPNLRILISLTPSKPIEGSKLLFGNECLTPIRDHVPVSLLSTGLKFFSWLINPSVKGDLYGDMPYFYGLALNSFTRIRVDKEGTNEIRSSISPITANTENLNQECPNLDIPVEADQRRSFFSNVDNASNFEFEEGQTYTFQFETNLVKLANSEYKLLIPTYGQRTIDIDVGQYANDQLNNFNWVLKYGGSSAAKEGTLGLLLNFALVE